MDVRDLAKPRYKSIDDKYPSPCISCDRKYCDTDGMCNRWKTRYFYRQKAINGFAKKHQIKPVTNSTEKNPCDLCSASDYCHSICPARAKWWDIQMEKLRKEIGDGQRKE